MQQPRVSAVPPYVSTSGKEAIELCEMAGLYLDPWQQLVLIDALGEREDGKWAAFEVGVEVPRQNGKGSILEARELIGLFLLGERLIVHSAHEFATSMEHFRRIRDLIEQTPELDREVAAIRTANGKEGIELKSGQRLNFKARTKGGGRGWTADLVVFDEAMEISEASIGSILPTLSARPNPQVWYTGSAVDQTIHDNGVVFSRVRERGHAGDDPALAFFEWSCEGEQPEWIEDEDAADPEMWAQANPGFGIRIGAEYVANERRALDPRTFAVERLGVGDWPSTSPEDNQIIPAEVWTELADKGSKIISDLRFAFDVKPDRRAACIAVGGKRADGRFHGEIIEHAAGTGWVAQRMLELRDRHKPGAIICDDSGPAASLIPDLEALGIEVTTAGVREHGAACGAFYDACSQDALRHLDTAELNAAIKGAVTRPLGDSWAWSRKNSSIDISPLVAVTLAVGVRAEPPDDGGELIFS